MSGGRENGGAEEGGEGVEARAEVEVEGADGGCRRAPRPSPRRRGEGAEARMAAGRAEVEGED